MTEPSTRLHLEQLLVDDAVAYHHVMAMAARAERPEAVQVLTAVAQRLRTQAFAHMEGLEPKPHLETDRLFDWAKLAREAGDHEEAEWFETVARANKVSIDRIAEATS